MASWKVTFRPDSTEWTRFYPVYNLDPPLYVNQGSQELPKIFFLGEFSIGTGDKECSIEYAQIDLAYMGSFSKSEGK